MRRCSVLVSSLLTWVLVPKSIAPSVGFILPRAIPAPQLSAEFVSFQHSLSDAHLALFMQSPSYDGSYLHIYERLPGSALDPSRRLLIPGLHIEG